MMRDFEQRLRKLESSLPPEQTEEEKIGVALKLFLMDAVGYYLGVPRPGEARVTAFARALGYEHGLEFRNAMMSNRPEFNEKYARANRKLFAKFGVDLDDAEWKEVVEAIKRIHAGLPNSYKERIVV